MKQHFVTLLVLLATCSVYCVGLNFGEVEILNNYVHNSTLGQEKTAVPKEFKGKDIQSFAGYIRVDDRTESDLFFWFFKAASNQSEPLVIWLPGGPGDQAVTSIFEENGPYYVKQTRGLKERKHFWSQVVNMLYIDSPVGTGFSSTKGGYATDLDTVSKHLCEALKIFYRVFPEVSRSPLYIGGESWGSKQAIHFAYNIHKNCIGSAVRLSGLIVGNGLYDPVNLVSAAEVYLVLGLLSPADIKEYQYKEEEIKKFIGGQQYIKAFEAYDKLVKKKLWPYPTLFQNKTGLDSPESALGVGLGRSLFGNLEGYMSKDVTRRSIHVGEKPFHSDQDVAPSLRGEIMRSVTNELGTLLSLYPVLVYHGQFNMIVPHFTASRALERVPWCGKSQRVNSPRHQWWLENDLAGYTTRTAVGGCRGVLIEALVRDAGRYTARDQPERMLDLIDKFTHNKL